MQLLVFAPTDNISTRTRRRLWSLVNNTHSLEVSSAPHAVGEGRERLPAIHPLGRCLSQGVYCRDETPWPKERGEERVCLV